MMGSQAGTVVAKKLTGNIDMQDIDHQVDDISAIMAAFDANILQEGVLNEW